MASSRPSRRQFLQGLAVLSAGLAGCREDDEARQTPTPVEDPPGGESSLSDLSVGLSSVAREFVAPVGVEVPVVGRRYVVDQAGSVTLLTGGERHAFLDLTDRLPDLSGREERGLLGVAFHPDFASNGRLYARYSAPGDDDLPSGYSHWAVLSEFRVDPETTMASADTERRLLAVPQPQPNNNGGDVVFGPDGYLYAGFGDGGGAGDAGLGHVSDWYDPLEGGNGQDVTENLLGSILRLDVDSTEADRPYAVPPDNPLVDEVGPDEQYAWGFGNPWGMSFGPEDHFYVADRGEDRYEEVNVVEKGGNYGWNVREGTHCFRRKTCPEATAEGDPLTPPVVEYSHEGGSIGGVSVVGGYLYDGTELPALEGVYLFSDWQAEGQLLAANPAEDGLWEMVPVPIVDDVEPHVLAFGRGTAGELYVCANRRGRVEGSSGAVYRLCPA